MVWNPLVSVIIPTYNRANYLPLAVESVLNQTYENLELYIIDDGSTDNTADVVSPYVDDRRVTYHKQANAGQGAATNRAIRLCKGEYIAFLDADDLWIREKLELQVADVQNRRDLGVLFSPCYYIDQSGNVIGQSSEPHDQGFVTGRLLIENFIPFGTSFVKKECFDNLGLFDEIVTGLDYDLWLRFSTRYKFGYISTPTLFYRVWPGQVTSNNGVQVYNNGIKIMKRFLEDFPGVVDGKTLNAAWAHTYLGLGQCLNARDGAVISAFNSYLRALRYLPTYFPAWKAIIKLMFCFYKFRAQR